QAHRMVNSDAATDGGDGGGVGIKCTSRLDDLVVLHATEAARVAVQLEPVTEVRIEGGSCEYKARALNFELRFVRQAHGISVRRGRAVGHVVVAVGDLVAVVVELNTAAEAQLKGNLAVVLPLHVLRIGSAADDETRGWAVARLDAGGHAGAGILLQIVGDDLLDGVGVHRRGGIGRAGPGRGA